MKNKEITNKWIQYGVVAAVAVTLYATGLHAEVIGFAQRGFLATGLMDPDVEQYAQMAKTEGQSLDEMQKPKPTQADFDFNLIDKEGKAVSLSKFKGKVIFLNMWATWCPPCIAEMPTIDKLHEEMGDEVAFVMLSLDQNFDKAKAFDKRKGYDLPIYSPASNLPAMYESNAIPTTYVIDAAGNLAWTHKGMADYSDPGFKKFLQSLK